jgi:peptidoglycan lytic transglycosylase G
MVSRNRKARKKRPSPRVGLLTAVILLALLAGGWASWQFLVPFGPAAETFVKLTPGSSSLEIGRQLAEAGVVRSQIAFDLMRLWKRGTLRAGEYRFDHPVLMGEVYDRIARGDVFTVAIVIPEGANIFDIAARIQKAGLGSRQDFLDAASQQVGLISDLDPAATSLEGYLFPDTYRFARPTSPKQIVAVMVHRFRTVAAQLGLKQNVHRIVTIASLIERETAVDSERPLVASVFVNRLAKHMPLMSDPSVIYGLELKGRWEGVIHESDLTYNTPYNTYIHPGLPPGPVANPGVRSLRAAMDPAHTDYLYFVAASDDPQGHSIFARTLDEHNRNVIGYRHAVKEAGGR